MEHFEKYLINQSTETESSSLCGKQHVGMISDAINSRLDVLPC